MDPTSPRSPAIMLSPTICRRESTPNSGRRSSEISLNGTEIFGNPTHIVGPFASQDDFRGHPPVFNKLTGLPSADLNVIIAILEHRDYSNELEAYSTTLTIHPPMQRSDHGTFAVGTTGDLGQTTALSVGTNTLSFDFSLFAVPEPSTWAMMLLGFFGLVFLGHRQTRTASLGHA